MAHIAKTPIVTIAIPSIYHDPLPTRMALCTPDTKAAVLAVVADLTALGFGLRLSEMFRSHEIQKRAHLDFVQGCSFDRYLGSGTLLVKQVSELPSAYTRVGIRPS